MPFGSLLVPPGVIFHIFIFCFYEILCKIIFLENCYCKSAHCLTKSRHHKECRMHSYLFFDVLDCACTLLRRLCFCLSHKSSSTQIAWRYARNPLRAACALLAPVCFLLLHFVVFVQPLCLLGCSIPSVSVQNTIRRNS